MIAGPGRPSLLTPALQEKLCNLLCSGSYRKVAAVSVGICERTLRHWCEWGGEGREPYAAFVAAIEKAESEGELALLAKVEAGGEGWQSKAWILERRWPARWSGRVRLQVSEELGAFADKVRRNLDEPTYRRVIEATCEDNGSPAADRDGSH